MADENATPEIGGASGPPRLKGQSMVEGFRAARAASRPTLRVELRAQRAVLLQERLKRLNRAAVAAPDQRPPAPAPEPASPASLPPDTGDAPVSVFAAYCGAAEQAPAADDTVPGVPVPASCEDTAQHAAPAAHDAPPHAAETIPLSAIGFGPGMNLRLGQLGIGSANDLAQANPAWLRVQLGDLSELVNPDAWIESARKACATPE